MQTFLQMAVFAVMDALIIASSYSGPAETCAMIVGGKSALVVDWAR